MISKRESFKKARQYAPSAPPNALSRNCVHLISQKPRVDLRTWTHDALRSLRGPHWIEPTLQKAKRLNIFRRSPNRCVDEHFYVDLCLLVNSHIMPVSRMIVMRPAILNIRSTETEYVPDAGL